MIISSHGGPGEMRDIVVVLEATTVPLKLLRCWMHVVIQNNAEALSLPSIVYKASNHTQENTFTIKRPSEKHLYWHNIFQ
ncbi:hypothetical protein TNCT_285841 [Trichonephila clavata]|uniref:Uncharacterized protein n=1 Tax=Trichonephila clavata TaxID=2740835 RepID=A0A8X6HF74_TRICU|nr:hypothetical protein TNCT_285841 [Trichonephila clavata]